ncbi:hypothetical protein EV421DRAFT_1479658 [Armillaria borealis]|uniref:Zinc finger C2H2 LYAR-type domain-containing protein n=1 Tax=Armillaria borealis TaxID=47425 RepID=A0AA39JWF6_9AGAR|nr:hypothetical protein EV421DRAFT_1479658 [Armillaria borealis]
MVSFHCNGCDDVVTKPKLMAHWNRCYAQVDCLDCSKTFNNPGEFKGHTSCVSEAEKYEKSVYKGPKTAPKNHYPPPDSAPAPSPQSSRGSFRGRGRGGYNNGWGRPQVPGTGANGTPLGTPKGSPPPVEVISLPQKRKVDEIEQDKSEVKANGATSDTKLSNDVDLKLMKKSKKEKKKKEEEATRPTKDDKKEIKEKKSKPNAGEETGVEGPKSKRKEKDSVKERESTDATGRSGEKEKERKEKKHRTKKDDEPSKGNREDGNAPSAEDESGSKLRKEKRKHKEEGKEEKKKSKKRTHASEEKAEKDAEVNAINVESRKRKREINEERSQPVLEEKEKKSKKEKISKEEKKEKGHKKHRRSTEVVVESAPLIAVGA